MYDIVIGRSKDDIEKLGTQGTILLGKQYVKMGRTTSLSNKVYMDISGAHVVFICGKRGGGKSYTMGVVAEGMAALPDEIRKNLSIIMLDTMGIYWAMKYPNKKDRILLEEWGMEPKGMDVSIYTPEKYYHEFKQKGIPTDVPFTIKPSELDSADWCMTFEINPNDAAGVLIERIISYLKHQGQDYDIRDIIHAIQIDDRSEKLTKDALENRFLGAEEWGVFSKTGTPIKDIAKGGQVTVLDMSCYATMSDGWKIKALVMGLVSKKLFIERMIERRNEEFKDIDSQMHYFSEDDKSTKQDMPLVWLVIDEAHEFLPAQGKNPATDPLVTIMREGRQPGISLILATQQPGKIHTDVMTQADTVISHRLTAKIDVESLSLIMQSYMREGLVTQLDDLPRVKGAAIVFDDTNERMYPIRVRPRMSWHGGGSPVAIKVKKNTENIL